MGFRSTMFAILGGLIVWAVNANASFSGQFVFPLEGGQEVPPVASPGSGVCSVDLAVTAVTVNCSYKDLPGTAVAAHIHAAPAGVNGGVVVPLIVSGGSTGNITGNGVLTSGQADDLWNGGMYINLHTDTFPGGELRGQIAQVFFKEHPVPVLTAWGVPVLVLLLLAGGFVFSRRPGRVAG